MKQLLFLGGDILEIFGVVGLFCGVMTIRHRRMVIFVAFSTLFLFFGSWLDGLRHAFIGLGIFWLFVLLIVYWRSFREKDQV